MSSSAKSSTDVNVLKAKRDTDLTSGSDGEKENSRKVAKRSKIPNYRKATFSTKCRSQRGKVSDRYLQQHTQTWGWETWVYLDKMKLSVLL